MVQPKNTYNDEKDIELHKIGCLGKIVGFKETTDTRFLIELRGIIRFEIIDEIFSDKNTENFTSHLINIWKIFNEKRGFKIF